MLQLHYYPGNASLAPHILLEEVGTPFELLMVDRTVSAQKAPTYLALNPNGLIPVLVDTQTGLVMYEAAAICLHLCDTHPDAALAPAVGSVQRAHFYKWLMWLTNTLQAALIQYFYPERWMNAGNAAGAAELKANVETKVGELLDLLDAEFARHGGPWLLGDNHSAVDAYAMMLCRWTRGFAYPARERTHLAPWLARVLERPAVQRALSTERTAPPLV